VRTRLLGGICAALVLLAGTITVTGAKADQPLGITLANKARQAPLFQIGFAKEPMDPDPADIKAGTIHLGGFGIFPTRASTGPMTYPDGTPEQLYVRAFAVKSASGVFVGAGLEDQGTFASDKQCACGIWDMRQKVAADRHIPVESIVINSDHSHGGPDLIGLWGGVPVHYLQYVHDQAVKAIEEALDNAQPAYLLAGSTDPVMPSASDGGYVPGSATPGEHLVHSQFSQDTATGHDDSLVDTELRVLQAVTPTGTLLGTMINYSAHADVAGSSNLGYTADWPGWIAHKTEQSLREPVAMTMVADVGRSQPPRPNSDAHCNQPGHPGCEQDKLDTYSRILLPFVQSAVSGATPVSNSTIANKEIFPREPGTNPALLAASYGGFTPFNGYSAYRGDLPPWITGTLVGTFVSSHRIGDLLLTANPGEAYPDIRFALQNSVKGYSKAFTFGLANDQLGYLIAPASEYPWITTSNPGNDNALFNVSATYGDHVLCTQTSEATALGFTPTGATQPYGSDANPPACPVYNVADLVPMGPAPQQPWPFGDGTTFSPPISP